MAGISNDFKEKININDIYVALYGKQGVVYRGYWHHGENGHMVKEKSSHCNVTDIKVGLFVCVGGSDATGTQYYKHLITGKVYRTSSIYTEHEYVVIKRSVRKLDSVWPDYVDTINRVYKGKVNIQNVCKIEEHLRIKFKGSIRKINEKAQKAESFDRKIEMVEH